VGNNVTIGEDNWLGPNVSIVKSTEPGLLFKGERSTPATVSTKDFFKIT
jgi:acetyltransferase-like isoleucine patch superfamily enzyme